jgi:CHRD domain-containing protein
MGIVRIGLAALVVTFLGAGGAGAAEQVYTAKLDGASEVPKTQSHATAEATFTVSPDGSKIAYTLSVHDLGDITMAHIHLGTAGKNGPVVVWLYPPSGKPKLIKGQENGELATGEITAASLQGPEKDKPLSLLVKAIQAGDAYVNIHTALHKAGEIRGQIK